jgi:adenine-specific DNA-methyltransferase
MARIEELIRDIADPRLRNQIATEISKLKARKKFGLVFEEHLPEIVLSGVDEKPTTTAAFAHARAR